MTMALQRGNCVRKFLFTFIICCACLSSLNAQVDNQPPGESITLKANNVPIYEVFKAIFKQTRFKVAYSNAIFDDRQKVTVNFSNASLNDVMNHLLKDSNIRWRVNEQVIILIQKEEDAPKKNAGDTAINTIDLTGKITDANGNPIPGATVMVKGSKHGAITDAEGVFTLPNVRKDAVVLISSVGYETREIQVKGKSILAQLNVRVSDLDETIVIAYGTTTRRLSTSNISTIKAAEIEKQPVNNPLLALQGRVPGLFVEQATGLPGTGVKVRIQGVNSFMNGTDPLYVIDGVPYTSQLLSSANPDLLGSSGGLGNPTGNPFSFVNPADIESIEILKDADATAIYGSRAANGAILITTKRGRPGPTRVNVNFQQGWGKMTRRLNLMNSQQYLEMRHEALKNDGLTANPDADFDLTLWDTTRYTDWQKELLGSTAQYTDVQASVSGGNDNTQFMIGGGYHRETLVFPGNFADQKGSAHFSVNHASSNKKFSLQLSGNYLIDNNQLPNEDLTNEAIRLAPVTPPLYNADGSLNWMPSATGFSTFINPLAYLYGRYKNQTTNLISNLLLSYELLPGLELKSSFGYTSLRSEEVIPIPLLSVPPEFRPFSSRTTQFGNNHINSWNIEPMVSFKRNWGKGKIEALLGSTIQQNNSKGQILGTWGYNSDEVMEAISSATGIEVASNTASVYKYNALFGRFNYNWQDKYIINFTGRRDGSSRFGAANRFQNFGAIGAAWLFSNETWAKTKMSAISFGKLRASYGIAGSDQINDYQFLNLYNDIPFVVPYQGVTGLEPWGLMNPYLQWEETRKLQFGLELGLFKDRILLNTNYFRNRSSNQLLNYSLPAIAGFQVVVANLPATVQNTGWEFSLNTTNIQARNFNWSSSLNLTVYKNKLAAFPDIEKTTYFFQYTVGESIMAPRLFDFIGVNEATGIYQFADSKGNLTYEPANNDKIIIKDPAPQFYGGFQNSVSYKGFQLDFLFQFVKQKAPGYSHGFFPGTFSGGFGNQPVSVLNRWQQPGDKAPVQRYNSDWSLLLIYNSALNSDAFWEDASYIRLKNISVSWQLPDSWKKMAHLQNCRLYIQGQNLLTITDYTGLDPETKSSTTLPPLRIITAGIQLTL